MRTVKKPLSLLLAVLMVATLFAACGTTNTATPPPATTAPATAAPATTAPATPAPATPNATPINLKVWGPQEEQTLLGQMVDDFKAQHPENTYNITLGVVGEPDAYSTYSTDPGAAADVFYFANDQLRDFVKAGGLYEITRNKDDISSRNLPGSVAAATLDGKLYGYPLTADNGYFLYYDKSVLSATDVQSLDQIIKVCEAANKKMFMDVSNGWYIASFFLGAGLNLSIGPDGRQVLDWNNATGLAVGQAIWDFTGSKAFLTGDDSVLKGGIGGTIAAGVSGTWNAADIEAALGDNYAATKLPTFTLNGQQVQMGSFGGYKLIGINSQTKEPVAAMDLADFLSNEANQVKRFEARQLGPSNINAAGSDAVKANVALAALAEQSQFAVSQNDVLASFWTPAEAFGTAMESRDTSKTIQGFLDDMVAQIQAG